MYDEFRPTRHPGATIRYAISLCVASVLLVSGIAYMGNKYSPQLTSWHESTEIDSIAVGSITRGTTTRTNNSVTKIEIGPDNTRTYRVYQLPKGLTTEE